MTYIYVGSHRAGDKLKNLLGSVDWYYTFDKGGHFALVPNKRLGEILAIKGIRRTRKTQEFLKCW